MNERASQRDERRPQLVVGARGRGRGARGRGRDGLKNDTQLLLMFLLPATQATPLDFFKPQTTTTKRTNCDQSRFSVRICLLLLLHSGSMNPRGVGTRESSMQPLEQKRKGIFLYTQYGL